MWIFNAVTQSIIAKILFIEKKNSLFKILCELGFNTSSVNTGTNWPNDQDVKPHMQVDLEGLYIWGAVKITQYYSYPRIKKKLKQSIIELCAS